MSRRRRSLWLLLAVTAGLALALVLTPAWIIQPFRPQSDRGVEISYMLRRLSPLATIAILMADTALAFMLWRGSRWWSKAILVLLLLPVGASTWLARQNHFEWMFAPLPNAAYARSDEATSVNDADLVIAVDRNGEAAAYPVRQLAYHHLVHDTLGRVPIVVTY